MNQAKEYIQNCANDHFPALELFIKDDMSYWAYDVQDNMVIVTSGNYSTNEGITPELYIDTRMLQGEINIRELIDSKIQEGFECFASLV